MDNSPGSTRGILKQALISAGFVLVILVMVMGAMALTNAFGRAAQTPIAQALTPTPTPTGIVIAPASPSPTSSQLPTETATRRPTETRTAGGATSTPEGAGPTPTSTRTAAPSQTPSAACTPAPNWTPLRIAAGETWEVLARRYGISTAALRAGNCHDDTPLTPGEILYVPPLANATTTPAGSAIPCGAPAGWSLYIVRPGDTLSGLAFRCGVSVDAVMHANCLSGQTIYVGQRLYLPCVPPAWPTAPAYPTVQPPAWTPWPTFTPIPVYPTPTPAPAIPPTSTPTAAWYPTPEPTQPPIPTPEPTQPPPTQPPLPTQPPPTQPPLPTQPPALPPTSTPTPGA